MLLIRIFCWVLNCCCHCICVSASLILPACHCLLLVLLLLQLVFYLFFNLHLFSYRITEEHLTNSNPKWWSTSIYSQRCKIFWCIKLSKFGILALRHHIVWLLLIPMITILPLKRILIRNTILVNWITLFLHNILVYKRSWLKWTLSTVSDSPYTTQTSWQTLAVMVNQVFSLNSIECPLFLFTFHLWIKKFSLFVFTTYSVYVSPHNEGCIIASDQWKWVMNQNMVRVHALDSIPMISFCFMYVCHCGV